MKTVEEIAKASNLVVISNTENGGCGRLIYGSLKNATVIWGRAEGGRFDHVGISPTNRTPTWEEMCKVKDIFFDPEEECYQVFPKRSQYVNIRKNCLHIWRDVQKGEQNE